MPTNTTTMALSSPSNPISLTVSAASQSSSSSILSTGGLVTSSGIGGCDELASPQLSQHQQQHDLVTSCETASTAASNGDRDIDGIIGRPLSSSSTNVNGLLGCSLTNGVTSTDIMSGDHDSSLLPRHNAQQHSPSALAAALSSQQHQLDTVDLNIKHIAIGSNSSSNIVDMSCLNVVTSTSPTSLSSSSSVGNVLNNNQFLNGAAATTNGHLLMAQQSAASGGIGGGGSSLNYQAASNSPDSSPWSIGGDVDSSSFVNYSFANNGLHKRAIMSQQPHHGLSPNSGNGNSNSIIGNNMSQQQQQQSYVHLNKNNGNNSSFGSSPWSNPMPWQSHHHQQHHQQQQMEQQILQQQQQQHQQSNWNNRGRSGLNSMSPHLQQSHQRKQHHTQYSMPPSASSSCTQGLMSPNSPSKYRRSTSYPGKHQQQHSMHNAGYQMDAMGGGIIEDQTYMSAYQVSKKEKLFLFLFNFPETFRRGQNEILSTQANWKGENGIEFDLIKA